MPLTGTEESLPGAEDSPETDEEAEAPREPVELAKDGGKGLEELTPVPGRIEFELIPIGRVTEFELTPVPKGMEGDKLTPVGKSIELEFKPVEGVTELGLTPVPKGTEVDVTPVGGRLVLELTPVPRGIELEELTPVPTGKPTPLLVVGNSGGTLLGLVPRNNELDWGGIETSVPGPVDGPETTLLVVGTIVKLPGIGNGAPTGITGGVKDGEGDATHSYPRGPTTSVEEGEMIVVGVERSHKEEAETRLG